MTEKTKNEWQKPEIPETVKVGRDFLMSICNQIEYLTKMYLAHDGTILELTKKKDPMAAPLSSMVSPDSVITPSPVGPIFEPHPSLLQMGFKNNADNMNTVDFNIVLAKNQLNPRTAEQTMHEVHNEFMEFLKKHNIARFEGRYVNPDLLPK